MKRGKKVTEDHDDDDSEDEEEHKTTLREEVEREYYPEKYHFWPFGDPFMYKVGISMHVYDTPNPTSRSMKHILSTY